MGLFVAIDVVLSGPVHAVLQERVFYLPWRNRRCLHSDCLVCFVPDCLRHTLTAVEYFLESFVANDSNM